MDANGSSGASLSSAAPSPLYPNTNATNGDAGAAGDRPGPLARDGSAGIPLGLSKLDREDLEVGNVAIDVGGPFFTTVSGYVCRMHTLVGRLCVGCTRWREGYVLGRVVSTRGEMVPVSRKAVEIGAICSAGAYIVGLDTHLQKK